MCQHSLDGQTVVKSDCEDLSEMLHFAKQHPQRRLTFVLVITLNVTCLHPQVWIRPSDSNCKYYFNAL